MTYDSETYTVTTALLPCPFCGAAPYASRAVNGTDMFRLGCSACGIEMKAAWYRGEKAPTRDIAIAWNYRASVATAEQAIDGVRKIVDAVDGYDPDAAATAIADLRRLLSDLPHASEKGEG